MLELALAPQESVVGVCVLLFVTGICYVLWGSSTSSGARVPLPRCNSRRRSTCAGKPSSLYFFAFQGGAPLGGLLAGWLTSHGGTSLAFTVAGVSAVVVAVAGASTLLSLQPNAADSDLRTLLLGERRDAG